MEYAVECSRNIERCYLEGLVHVIPSSNDGVKENDIVAVAFDPISEGSLMLIQLNRSIDSPRQHFTS